MTDEDRAARIAKLERLLAVRKNVPGYGPNCKAIEAELERLKT